MSRKYVLDSNTFIEAKNRYYGFDICPGYWTSLLTAHSKGRVCSVDRIEKELLEQQDELTCFMFFGQWNILFWTAQGELSDVESEVCEAVC